MKAIIKTENSAAIVYCARAVAGDGYISLQTRDGREIRRAVITRCITTVTLEEEAHAAAFTSPPPRRGFLGAPVFGALALAGLFLGLQIDITKMSDSPAVQWLILHAGLASLSLLFFQLLLTLSRRLDGKNFPMRKGAL